MALDLSLVPRCPGRGWPGLILLFRVIAGVAFLLSPSSVRAAPIQFSGDLEPTVFAEDFDVRFGVAGFELSGPVRDFVLHSPECPGPGCPVPDLTGSFSVESGPATNVSAITDPSGVPISTTYEYRDLSMRMDLTDPVLSGTYFALAPVLVMSVNEDPTCVFCPKTDHFGFGGPGTFDPFLAAALGIAPESDFEFFGQFSAITGNPTDAFRSAVVEGVDRFDFTVHAVPEPTLLCLTGLTAAGLAMRRRRQRARVPY